MCYTVLYNGLPRRETTVMYKLNVSTLNGSVKKEVNMQGEALYTG